MLGDIKAIIGAIIGLVIGAVIAALISWGYNAVTMSNLRSEKDKAIAEKLLIKEQWQEASDKLSSTTTLLNDTLAAIELLRSYQSIDNDTKKDLSKIDKTLDDEGKPTEETYNEFRDLMEEFNILQGRIATDSGREYDTLDIRPFNELYDNAEKLFKEATKLVFEVENENN